jgi:Fe2+ transport protein.
MDDNPRFNRRAFLAATGVSLTSATAGCLNFGPDDNTPTETNTETKTDSPTETPGEPARQLPSVAAPDEPAVYIPSHFDGREMLGMQESGPYMMSLMYTLVHDFWVFAGQEPEHVPVQEGQTMHIMSSVWDPEFGNLLPTGNPDITITTGDGEEVDQRSLWSMLAQQMGPHFGDNVTLPESGEYNVTIDVDPVSARQLGAYVDRFNSAESATFTFDFQFEDLTDIRTELLNDAGQNGALPPASMGDRPSGSLPDVEELPGFNVGVETSGQAEFAVQRLHPSPDGLDSSDPYIAVSPRTPYNKYPLPFMGVRGTVTAPDETELFKDILQPALHPELGYHYGAVVRGLASEDTLELEIGSPPQISRHRGYQTAFREFEDLQFTI